MVLPYVLARPALRKTMQVHEPTPQEVRLLQEMTRRVDTYPDHEPLSDPKHGGERGTEAVLNALILACCDAERKRAQPSEVARKAFHQLWQTQRADGAWDWMNYGQEPDESDASQYYGAALAAIAVGTAPGGLAGADPASLEYVDKLRSYLNIQYAGQHLYNRVWMLLASARLSGLLNSEERGRLTGELKAKQKGDGGWSLYSLGPWRWSKTAPPFAPPGKPDLALLEKSDGYATGLIVYALRETGLSANDQALTRATAWLRANQKEARIEGHVWECWRTYSLNQDRENGGAVGGEWKQMLMSDMATAFAVLALSTTD
jgi:squalene-hopene/tetraprenyl-beta-curcumene cyclase